MSRALVSLAVGFHERLLEIALPSFHEFADRHGYEVVIPEPIDCSRPPSWWKVPAMLAALEEFDEVLFLDADMVIVDPSEDVDVPEDFWQAVVQHSTGDGGVPNCGVWFVRRPMVPVLRQIWTMEQYLNHGWWEQAAMHELMGFSGRPLQLISPTDLYDRTFLLDPGWNVHKWHRPEPERARIMHASMFDDRAGVMRGWAEIAEREALCAS